MAWDAHQIARRPWALFDSNSFHPYPRSLAFADHLTPEAVMVAPVVWITGNAVLAFNAGVVAALALSALTMFALVRRVTGRADAAFLAGLAYAFTSFTRHELPRVHVLHVQWWPLALLFLLRFADRGRRRDAVLFAGALSLQALSGSYYLAYSLLCCRHGSRRAYVGCRRCPARREAAVLAVALGCVALAVLPFVLPYLAQFRAMGIEKELVDGADLLAYVDPEPRTASSGASPRLAVSRELPHFVGIRGRGLRAGRSAEAHAPRLFRGGARAGLDRARDGGHRAAALAGSDHPRRRRRAWGPGPYALLHRLVPPARGMASPERIGVLVTLGSGRPRGPGRRRAPDAAALAARGSPSRARWRSLLPLEHWTPSRRPAPVPAGPTCPRSTPPCATGRGR